MSDKPKRCVVCHGWGYLPCDCWPGDCICGWGDQDCEECEGHGFIFPDPDHDPYLEDVLIAKEQERPQ